MIPQTPARHRQLDYFDTRAAVDAIAPGAYDRLPYTSRVLAEHLVRRCDPAMLEDALRRSSNASATGFPGTRARGVSRHPGQTALVDLAGLRDAIADRAAIRRRSTRWCRRS